MGVNERHAIMIVMTLALKDSSTNGTRANSSGWSESTTSVDGNSQARQAIYIGPGSRQAPS